MKQLRVLGRKLRKQKREALKAKAKPAAEEKGNKEGENAKYHQEQRIMH